MQQVEEMTAEQRQQRADEIAAEYERWSYGEGWKDGRLEGARDGWKDGYTHGFDVGAEVGGMRVLLAIEHVIGRDKLDELTRDADNKIPHVGDWLDYRARTTYEAPAEQSHDDGAEL